MSLTVTLLEVASNAALGIWLGSIVFFSFVGAPTIFSALPMEEAGQAVNAVFPRYYLFGLGLGVVALAATAGRGAVDAFDAPLVAMLATVAVGVLTNAYARWVLIPRMEDAGDEAFDRYHGRSVLLNGVTLLAVATALVASHL
ncbi:DUF4149 domain-containing protein [Halobacteriales archaeon QS_1_68_20]|nr:MAG: DUF4149 domain-containing protein [Halobacteriales archaeon QS_1_68_20]